MTLSVVSNIARSAGDPKVVSTGPSSMGGSDQLAKALGWFSIGLGLTELIAPHLVTNALGMQGKEGLVRSYGAREIASGLLTLSPDKQAGLWSRVAGDGLDLATLMSGLRADNPKRDNVAAAITMVLGVTLLDIIGAQTSAVRHATRQGQRRTYSDRSGFPQGVAAARGAAAKESQAPRNPRTRPSLAYGIT